MRSPVIADVQSETSVMINLFGANEAYVEPVIHYYVIVVKDDVATQHRPDEFDTEEVSIKCCQTGNVISVAPPTDFNVADY